jgi:hypothetical protein
MNRRSLFKRIVAAVAAPAVSLPAKAAFPCVACGKECSEKAIMRKPRACGFSTALMPGHGPFCSLECATKPTAEEVHRHWLTKAFQAWDQMTESPFTS